MTFRGFGGHPIKGWLNVPRGADGPLAAVVEYIGYGGGRGLPHDWLLFSAAGYAHLVMDTRGQGGTWLGGDTPDPAPTAGTHHPGFLTLGIEHPDNHYYRRLYVDGVRAVEAVRAFPGVDPERVAVLGTSQGGGITIAVAGLVGDLRAALPSVPFLCDMRRAASSSTPIRTSRSPATCGPSRAGSTTCSARWRTSTASTSRPGQPLRRCSRSG